MKHADFWWARAEKARRVQSVKKETAYIIATSLPVDNRAGEVILKKFLAVVGANFYKVHVIISGSTQCLNDVPEWIMVHQTGTGEREATNLATKMWQIVKSQIKMCMMLSFSRLKDKRVFFWNAGLLLLPHIIVRLKRGRSIYFRIGDITLAPRQKYPGVKGRFIGLLLGFLQSGNIWLASKLAVEHLTLALQEEPIKRNKHKVLEISLFVDQVMFKKTLPSRMRPWDIIFLGRLTPEKGVANMLEAIREIELSGTAPPSLRIIGSGPMQEYVEKKVAELTTVSFLPWVEYDTVGELLNQAKVLLLPSDTEGLPNVIIEAMGCGTVPIATPVGGIPGVVHPGKTGFILKDNSQKIIMETVEVALSDKNLEKLSQNAANYVLENYSYEAAVERMRKNLVLR